jgi:hypothetical protein
LAAITRAVTGIAGSVQKTDVVVSTARAGPPWAKTRPSIAPPVSDKKCFMRVSPFDPFQAIGG